MKTSFVRRWQLVLALGLVTLLTSQASAQTEAPQDQLEQLRIDRRERYNQLHRDVKDSGNLSRFTNQLYELDHPQITPYRLGQQMRQWRADYQRAVRNLMIETNPAILRAWQQDAIKAQALLDEANRMKSSGGPLRELKLHELPDKIVITGGQPLRNIDPTVQRTYFDRSSRLTSYVLRNASDGRPLDERTHRLVATRIWEIYDQERSGPFDRDPLPFAHGYDRNRAIADPRGEGIRPEVAALNGRDPSIARPTLDRVDAEVRAAMDFVRQIANQSGLQSAINEYSRSELSKIRQAMRAARSRGPRVRGAIFAVADLIGPFVDARIDADAEQIAKGVCPSRLAGDEEIFSGLLAADWSLYETVAADCARQGRPLDFSSQRQKFAESRYAISQARCASNGSIHIIHRNGASTTLRFADAMNLAQISSRPSDSERPVATYTTRDVNAGERAPRNERVTVQADVGRRTAELRERWGSFALRASCAVQALDCERNFDAVARGLDAYTEETTSRTPFGEVDSARTHLAANTLSAVKQLLMSRQGQAPTFAQACESLGGRAPETTRFVSTNSSPLTQSQPERQTGPRNGAD